MRSFRHWILLGIGLLILAGCGEPPETEIIEDVALENALADDVDDELDEAETAVEQAEETEEAEEMEEDEFEEDESDNSELEENDEEPQEEMEEEMEEDAPDPSEEATLPPPAVEEEAVPPPPTPEPKPFDFTQAPPQIVNGETAVIAGTAPNIGGDVTVELVAGPHLLAQTSTQVNGNGDWEVQLPVPFTVYGAGRIRALSGVETAVRPVGLLVAEADPLGVTVNGVQPFPDTTAVSGAPLFFAGNVTNAINQTVVVSFLIDECRETVSTQTITLGGEAVYWNAFIILPQNLADDRGCASILTGDPASGEWREQIIPMQLVQLGDEAAEGLITVGNRPDMPFDAGSSIYLFGSAINLPEPFIEIEWIGEGDNPVFIVTSTDVDNFGYWDVDIDIPEGLSGQTTMIISAGEGEDAISAEFSIPVVP